MAGRPLGGSTDTCRGEGRRQAWRAAPPPQKLPPSSLSGWREVRITLPAGRGEREGRWGEGRWADSPQRPAWDPPGNSKHRVVPQRLLTDVITCTHHQKWLAASTVEQTTPFPGLTKMIRTQRPQQSYCGNHTSETTHLTSVRPQSRLRPVPVTSGVAPPPSLLWLLQGTRRGRQR